MDVSEAVREWEDAGYSVNTTSWERHTGGGKAWVWGVAQGLGLSDPEFKRSLRPNDGLFLDKIKREIPPHMDRVPDQGPIPIHLRPIKSGLCHPCQADADEAVAFYHLGFEARKLISIKSEKAATRKALLQKTKGAEKAHATNARRKGRKSMIHDGMIHILDSGLSDLISKYQKIEAASQGVSDVVARYQKVEAAS